MTSSAAGPLLTSATPPCGSPPTRPWPSRSSVPTRRPTKSRQASVIATLAGAGPGRYRWSDTFYWNGGAFRGQVPAATVVDLTARYNIGDRTSLQINVANILDNVHYEMFGGDSSGDAPSPPSCSGGERARPPRCAGRGAFRALHLRPHRRAGTAGRAPGFQRHRDHCLARHGPAGPPFETVGSVASALAKREARLHGGSEPSPLLVSCNSGTSSCVGAEADLRVPLARGPRDLHVYEVYWAPLTEGKITLAESVKFLIGTGVQGVRYAWWPPRLLERYLFGRWVSFQLHWQLAMIFLGLLLTLLSLIAVDSAMALTVGVKLLTDPGDATRWPSYALFRDLTFDLAVLTVTVPGSRARPRVVLAATSSGPWRGRGRSRARCSPR